MENKFLRRNIFFLLIVFLLNIQAFSFSNIITEIEFSGNIRFDSKQIELFLKSKIGNVFDPDILRQDINRIYQAGFFSDVGADTEQFKGGVKIIFKVIENSIIKNISFSDVSIFPDRYLLKVMELKIGDFFNFNQLKKDIVNLEKFYSSRGYVLAKVVDVDVKKNGELIDIKIIEPVIEDIIVKGNINTGKDFIIKKLNIEKGKNYNLFEISKGVENLKKMDIFENIRFFIKDGSVAEYIMVEIHVTEKKTGELAFGINYGRYNGLVGSVSFEKKNFRGKGEELKFEIELGQVTNFDMSFIHPYIGGSSHDLKLDIFSFDIDKDKFDNNGIKLYEFNEKKEGFSVAAIKNNEKSEQSIRFSSENIDIDIGAGVISDNKDWFGISRTIKEKNGLLSLAIDFSGYSFLKGDKDITKIKGEKRIFFKRNKSVNAIRLMGEDINLAASNLFEHEKASLGGGNSLRGYKTDSFTSSSYWLVNLEHRMKFNNKLWGVIFTDFGRINSENKKTLGFGLAFNTPLGIIRIDYGKPVNDDNVDTGRFYFGSGFMF